MGCGILYPRDYKLPDQAAGAASALAVGGAAAHDSDGTRDSEVSDDNDSVTAPDGALEHDLELDMFSEGSDSGDEYWDRMQPVEVKGTKVKVGR